MSTIIKPTVGRKVWYRPCKNDLLGPGAMICSVPRDNPTQGQPLDATVLAVWGDRCVNVLVLDTMGKPFTKTSITLLQEGDTPAVDTEGNPVGGYVEWMPHQAKVAAQAAEEDTRL